MLEAWLYQGSVLKKAIECVKGFASNVYFVFSSSEATVDALNPSRDVLVSFRLEHECFECYRCNRDISVRLDLNYVSKRLYFSDDHMIAIKAEDESNTVTFISESPSKDVILEFEMPLVEFCNEDKKMVEAEWFEVIVRMPSAKFDKICKYLASMDDSVDFCVTKEGVEFSIKGRNGDVKIVVRDNTRFDKLEEATMVKRKEELEPVTDNLGVLKVCHKSHTIVKHSYAQIIGRQASYDPVQDQRCGLSQILLVVNDNP